MGHLPATQKLAQEFRAHRLASGFGEDVLQFYNLANHAWTFLSKEYEYFTSEPPGLPIIAEDTNMADRVYIPPDDASPLDVTPGDMQDMQSITSQLVYHTSDSSTVPNKRKRQHTRYTVKPPGRPKHPNRRFPCPFCVPQYFNRTGLVDHL